METPHAACTSASSTLAGIVASGRASVPARNNRQSVGATDGCDTSFGSYFSRLYILLISIQKIAKSIRTGLLQKIPDDLGFLTTLDQTDGELSLNKLAKPCIRWHDPNFYAASATGGLVGAR